MPVRLSSKAVGSTVKCKVNGTYYDFIVVHQGNPKTSLYDSSCNGTWLLMKNIYTRMYWLNDTNSGWYTDSPIHSYINGTFYNAIESGVRGLIKQVKVPYYTDSFTIASGASGLSTKVFLLSGPEVGDNYNDDGSVLSYFNSDAKSKRISSAGWWLRSRNYYGLAFEVNTAGAVISAHPSSYNDGVRPAFIMNGTCWVLDDNSLSANAPPTISGSGTSLGTKNAPFSFSYTVNDADGNKLTVTEKLDGNTIRTLSNVSSGTTTTFAYASNADTFQQILNGSHTITVTVSDGTASASYSASFTKSVTSASITLTTPLAANAVIKVAVLSLDASIPDDAVLKIEMTNNGKDASPVWEDATKDIAAKANHLFANTTAANGFAFNFRITVSRGSSGASGYIRNIGGAFE